MVYRFDYAGGVWIDLENPSAEEVRGVIEEFGISERVGAELALPTPSPLVASDDNSQLLVLHFPAYDSSEESEAKSQELDFVVGPHFIVTVRYEVIAPLRHLKKILETEMALAQKNAGLSTDILLEILFSHLYTSVRDHASHTAGRLRDVEREMFGGHERETVRAISDVSRIFLHLEGALAGQEEPVGRFLKSLEGRGYFGPSFTERTARINAERSQVAHLVRTHRAITTELRETNNALLSAKQNEVIKLLTVVSFIFLPLALIAKIFAMKVDSLPFAHDPNGFWIILGIMFGLAIILTVFVLKKRWL